MTYFSRCDAPRGVEAGLASSPRRRRVPAASGGLRRSLSDFVEDVAILIRYAAGLDYYGRDQLGPKR